jgi:uncharacterized protein (DUF1684 family)
MKPHALPRAALLALASLYCTVPAADPVAPAGHFAAPAGQPADWSKDLLDWRAQRAQKLSAPEGWMSLTGLEPIPQGSSAFGGAAGDPIHLKGQVPEQLGVLRREGEQIKLLPPPGGFPAGLQLDGKPAQAQLLQADDAPQPTRLTYGTLVFFVIHRADRYILRVKDAQSPTRTQFQHLNWFEPDPAYRVRARWTPYVPPKTISIASIIGTEDKSPVPGVAQFSLGGKTYTLEPIIEQPGDTQLFFMVRDSTSAKTSYGAGRFLYADFPDHGLEQPGELTLDFNRLQNPPCAYTPYATCPLPPKQNWLKAALPAGEKKYHEGTEGLAER